MANKYFYLLFSATPYKMGHLVRCFTRSDYNHVSIMLDPNYEEMYSFARRNYYHPFYGGFVKESTDRFCLNGDVAEVKVCKIPISEDRLLNLKKRLNYMQENEHEYLYNFLAIFGVAFKRNIKVKNAYTCIEFAVDVLSKSNFDISPNQYYDIYGLETLLDKYVIYQGPISLTTYDEMFFEEIPHVYTKVVKNFAYLFLRKTN